MNPVSREEMFSHEFQLFYFHPVAPDSCKAVLRLLHKPAFFGATENPGQPHGHSGDMPRFPFTSSESVSRVKPRLRLRR